MLGHLIVPGCAGAQPAPSAAAALMPGPVSVSVLSSAGGGPVRGAQVRVGGRFGATNAAGLAVIDGLPAGEYPLIVDQPGYELAEQKLSPPAGNRQPVAVTFTPVKMIQVEGTVALEDSSQPVPGASVVMTPVEVRSAMKGTLNFATAWDGKFKLLEIPPGKYRCDVSAAGCEPASVERTLADGAARLDLKIGRTTATASLTVTVMDAVSRKPVANASVQVCESWPAGLVAQAQSGADGAAAFAALPTGQVNWADDKDAVAVARRAVSVGVVADGYETAVVPAVLDGARTVAVEINPLDTAVESEPNDTFETANQTHPGQTIEFKAQKQGDKDCFRFRVRQTSLVRVEIAKGNPLAADAAIMNTRAEVLASTWNYALNGVVATAWLYPGEYCAMVWAHGGETSDKPFRVSITSNETVDNFEPNDQPEQARLLRAGEEVRGIYSGVGTADHFRIELKRPCAIRALLEPHALAQRVHVLDRAGVSRASVWNYARQPCDMYAALQPGVYTLRVSPHSENENSTAPYSLRYRVIEDDGTDDTTARGASGVAPRSIAPGTMQGFSIWPRADNDRFAVSLPGSGRLRLRAALPVAFDLAVATPQGKVLGSAWQYANQPLDLAVNIEGPCMVHILCSGHGDDERTPSPYVLHTTFESCDEFETSGRNDTPATATPLDPGETVHACVLPQNDVDLYAVDVDHPGILRVETLAPIAYDVAVYAPSGKKLAGAWQYAAQPLVVEPEVLPGPHIVEVRGHGDVCDPGQYELCARLLRADPLERVPLKLDPIRTLQPGVAESWAVDHAGDVDRFVFNVTQAGKYSVAIAAHTAIDYHLWDDRTREKIADTWNYAGATRIKFEAKGPARYRLDLSGHGTDKAPKNNYVLVGSETCEIAGDFVEPVADPCDPVRVDFQRKPLGGAGRPVRIALDAQSDGTIDVQGAGDAPLTWRYPRTGLYVASVWFEDDKGGRTRSLTWVQATGYRERKGIMLGVDRPGEGQAIDSPEPVTARAVSYTGARIARVLFKVDGRTVDSAYTPPFQVDVPWQRFGAGQHVLTATAFDAAGDSASVDRSFTLSEYFGLSPENGAVLTGEDVRVSWTGGDFGPATVRVRLQDETTWTEVIGQSGRERVVMLKGLEAGKTYEFQPVGAGEPGPIRTVTRVKGLAFGRSRYGANIQRDYDQKVPVSVRNHGEKPLTVRLECGRPADPTMLVGFVGEGSEGAPFDLGPGEERDFLLGISAQDVTAPVHTFPVRLVSDAGLSDEAEVELHVKLPEVKLEWAEAGEAKHGIGKVLRLVNRADSVTDLAISSNSPDLILSPTVKHGLFPAGQSMEITVMPRLFDGFQSAQGMVTASAVGKSSETPVSIVMPAGKQARLVNVIAAAESTDPGQTSFTRTLLEARMIGAASLEPDKIDWSAKEAPEDQDNDGRPDRWRTTQMPDGVLWVGDDTDADGVVDFVHADLGPDGQFEYSAMKTKDGWQRTNLVEAWLETAFSLPWNRDAYEKHDVDIVLNDKVIGQLRDTIPEGNYTFRVPPSLVLFNDKGYPEANRASIRSKHLRGGHYVVNSEFRLKTRLTATPVWTVAASEADALASAAASPGVSVMGPDYSVSSGDVRVAGGGEIKPGTPVQIDVPVRNLGATVGASVDIVLMVGRAGQAGVERARHTLPQVGLLGASVATLALVPEAGRNDLRIVVDPEATSGDTNRKNNEARISISGAGAPAAKPVVKIVEPTDGAVLKDAVCVLKVDATGEGGIARVEACIDGALWQPLACNRGACEAKCLLQPGEHRIAVRATDSSGSQADATVKVRVDMVPPEVRIVAPAAESRIDAGSVAMKFEVPAGTVVAAARVDGGAWHAATVQGTAASVDVPLRFGEHGIEALAASPRGAVGMTSVTVTCTYQPAGAPPQPAPPLAAGGEIDLGAAGRVNVLAAPNTLLGVRAAAPATAARGTPTTAPARGAPPPWAGAGARLAAQATATGRLASNNANDRAYALLAMGLDPAAPVADQAAKMLGSDPDPGVRVLAASMLSSLGGKAPVGPLVDALNDKETAVRVAAAVALGTVPDARAARALAKACNDTNTSVSQAAIGALAWNLEMVPDEETTGTATADDGQSTAPAGSAAQAR